MCKRSVALFLALLFLLSGIIVRIYTLTDGSLLQAADAQSTVTLTVAETRGTIYDCHLNRLTNQKTAYSIAAIPTPKALAALSETLSTADWDRLSKQLQKGKPVSASFDRPAALANGILQFLTPVRYTENQTAAHVIGHLDESGHGVSGIEQALDTLLTETGGSIRVTYRTDAKGSALQGEKASVVNTVGRSQSGIALTLDQRIQHAVEVRGAQLLDKGAIVVMEPDTGNLVAMASFPDFEPAALSQYLDATDSPLFNRATAAYNCGSVFKIVSTAAALESGIPLSQKFYCTGSIPVGTNTIKCHYLLGHGQETMTEGFVNSCNPYFIQLMQLVGRTPLYRMASSLGFDSPVLLVEGYKTARAVLPDEDELMKPTALANLSFGQGSLTATPVHIAQMTAAVANGGTLHRATLYAGQVDEKGVLTQAPEQAAVSLFSKQTADAIGEMMVKVIEEGNGASAAPSAGKAAGKTGTAETGWVLTNGKTMVQSWFTGYYPAENPQYVITVLAEDTETTGKKSAPVFKTICDELYRMGYIKTDN